MWVFIDDSGDCGMKFDSGSSDYVVMTACVFKTAAAVEATDTLVETARLLNPGHPNPYRFTREFKYSKTKESIKNHFFETMTSGQFAIRAIVVDKRKLYSEHLRTHPNDLKSYLIKQLLTHTFGTVRDAKIVIDGQDNRAFGRSDHDYFMDHVNSTCPGTIASVQFRDSKKDNLLQLADMICGTIHGGKNGDKLSKAHWDTFRSKTWQPDGSVWHF